MQILVAGAGKQEPDISFRRQDQSQNENGDDAGVEKKLAIIEVSERKLERRSHGRPQKYR